MPPGRHLGLARPKPWRGDLEPILPVPLRNPGRRQTFHGEVCRHIDFDEAGERILVAGRHGLLFTAWRIDGDEPRSSPSPSSTVTSMRAGSRTVIGVAGGLSWW